MVYAGAVPQPTLESASARREHDFTELVIVFKIPMHFHRTFKFQHTTDNWLERAVREIRDNELCRDHSAYLGAVDS
jgi:hypothetical protein